MQYRPLGPTEIDVSRIILGCGNFGGVGSAPEFFGRGETDEEAFRIMDAAWAMGVTTFDPADGYGGGRSGTAIGRWFVRQGKVRAGGSNVDAEQPTEASRRVPTGGWSVFEWVQTSFNLLDQAAGDDVLPLCVQEELGFTLYGALVGGWLTGSTPRASSTCPGRG